MNTSLLEKENVRDVRFAVAGWFAIASAGITLPLFFLGLLHDIGKVTAVLPFLMLLGVLQAVFSIYAFYQFKNLLNEYHGFHAVDTLIIVLIIAQIVLVSIGMAGRFFPDLKIPIAIMLGALSIPTGIIGIIFCVRLLKLNATLHGLLKPYAYINMVACILVLTIVGWIIAVIIFGICDAMLGVIFLRGKEEEKVEFV